MERDKVRCKAHRFWNENEETVRKQLKVLFDHDNIEMRDKMRSLFQTSFEKDSDRTKRNTEIGTWSNNRKFGVFEDPCYIPRYNIPLAEGVLTLFSADLDYRERFGIISLFKFRNHLHWKQTFISLKMVMISTDWTGWCIQLHWPTLLLISIRSVFSDWHFFLNLHYVINLIRFITIISTSWERELAYKRLKKICDAKLFSVKVVITKVN